MERVTIYHNPACGNSRGALEILKKHKVSTEIVEYLKTPPDRSALERILELLPGEPAELVRKDKRFKELRLDETRYASRAQVIELLLEHPELMQRPVVIRGARAIIARPPERVLELLG